MEKIKKFLNKKINKMGAEMSISTIIVLIVCLALLIFVFIFSGSLRSYLLSLMDRFSLRGR